MTNIDSVSNKNLIAALDELQKKLNFLFYEKLKKIILFGSYARGDNDIESDVDVLVIIDDVNIRRYNASLSNIELELFDKYNLLISILPENENYFVNNSNQLPFFRNVNEEGVLVYG
ncbi:MAG: nucleotidyltransferase domain-containing protein [Bacteroidota bacterium]|nr:nucleotidyltransferase domain-containing protein [Bacteroidota bacterium]